MQQFGESHDLGISFGVFFLNISTQILSLKVRVSHLYLLHYSQTVKHLDLALRIIIKHESPAVGEWVLYVGDTHQLAEERPHADD